MNWNHILTRMASWLIVSAGRLLFWTLRRELRFPAPGSNAFERPDGHLYLFAVWHDLMLVPIFAGPQKYMASLVSKHQDGSYLAQSLERLGMMTVRGSSTRGGAAAIRRMMDVTKHKHITITPDGPQGPRRKMKAGMVFLASQTGRAIIPTGHSATRCWRIQGRWTDLMVPKPFSKFYLLTGDPIHVPPDISREEVRYYVERVQRAMEELQVEADRLAQSSVKSSTESPTLPLPVVRTSRKQSTRRAA
ncbi:MAG: lysophospholipid acyltransferase family protein [Planctomycetota bacterium]|nr:lysophospholipid acyltransferase family protein [Planctomycetota bacterium]MDA1213625.1 lysophospholipid acyltransferase family protein [Planctomycetota bacterium]